MASTISAPWLPNNQNHYCRAYAVEVRKRCSGFSWALGALCLATLQSQSISPADRRTEETLSFQTHREWSPRINLDADVAMNYGIDSSLPARMETWRKHGYRVQVMTGVAWGEYQDYLFGRYDGKNHRDEAQTQSDGIKIQHGKDIPYISPGIDYGHYLTVGVKRALDAGAEAIYLEEPEFWARAGWSASFKQEWQDYYKEPWQAPNSSVDAQYRASKLKYFLYRRALGQVFHFVHDYGKEHGRTIRCYVPTHSLINYADWRIVSPESSLIEVGTDGYIAQVWTGTARTPNVYQGRLKERTFETAYLEYSAMQNLVRASGRRVWYLNDPIEDNPNHSWSDYRRNWESTLTASLLQPEVWRYEIMPWPERIFNGKHLAADGQPGGNAERVGIPQSYATELQVVIHALGEMRQPASAVRWEQSGTGKLGVLVSDTMMFERADPHPSDTHLGSFFGLAMPLVKQGMPVEPVQIEGAGKSGFLAGYRILLLTYEGQKPPTAQFHKELAAWVKQGGALIVVDDDRDPYNAVRAWWNEGPLRFRSPRQQLFEELGLREDATGIERVGKGLVLYEPVSPAGLTYQPGGAAQVLHWVQEAAKAEKLDWKERNALVLKRGPYVVAAGLDESAAEAEPYRLRGTFIDLFDSQLPIVRNPLIKPGMRGLFFELAARHWGSRILAAGCQIHDEHETSGELRFKTKGIGDTQAVIRLSAPRKPREVRVNGKLLMGEQIAFEDKTVRLFFANAVEESTVDLQF